MDEDEKPPKKRRRRYSQENLTDDVRALLQTEAGCNFIGWLLHETRFLEGGQMTGEAHTFFNLGRREVGVEVFRQITRADRQALVRLMNRQLETQHADRHPAP